MAQSQLHPYILEKTLDIHSRSLTQRDRRALYTASEAISNFTLLSSIISSSITCLLAFRGRGNLLKGLMHNARQARNRRTVDKEMGDEWGRRKFGVFGGVMGWTILGFGVGWNIGGTMGRARAQTILERESDNYFRVSQSISETIWALRQGGQNARDLSKPLYLPGESATLQSTKPTKEILPGDPRMKSVIKDKLWKEQWEREKGDRKNEDEMDER